MSIVYKINYLSKIKYDKHNNKYIKKYNKAYNTIINNLNLDIKLF